MPIAGIPLNADGSVGAMKIYVPTQQEALFMQAKLARLGCRTVTSEAIVNGWLVSTTGAQASQNRKPVVENQ